MSREAETQTDIIDISSVKSICDSIDSTDAKFTTSKTKQAPIQKFFKKNQSTKKSLEEHFVESQKIKEEESQKRQEMKLPQDSEYFKKIIVDYMLLSKDNNDRQTQIMRNAILDYLSISTENKLKINEMWVDNGGTLGSIAGYFKIW